MVEKILHPELINLASEKGTKKITQAVLDELGAVVVEEYESDDRSRNEWVEKHRLWSEIYYQQDKSYSENSDWSSEQSIPLLTEACNQFSARCRKAFFPNKDFVGASLSSLGTFDEGMNPEQMLQEAQARMVLYKPMVLRTQKHLNYQLTIKNPHYKQAKDALWLSLSVHGSVFTKAYWDHATGQPRVDTVRAEDIVVPYNVGPIPISELPRKTHKLFWSKLKTKMKYLSGFFNSECDICDNISQHIGPSSGASDEGDGVQPSTNMDQKDNSNLCFILEQHRYWEIEGIIVPVIVWVDYTSKKVKRLAIRYETDDTGNPINDRQPIEYFTHYKFLENPDGFYGYGYGHMLGSVNLAINDGLRLSLDAALLATEGNMSGFISQRLTPENNGGDTMKLSLGQYTVVPDNIENIASGIKNMEFTGPNAALVDLIQFLDTRGQRLGSVTEASTGQVDKIRQSNALMTELEQALELPSNIHMRIVDSLTEELGKVYRLNRVHLDRPVAFVVNDKPEIVTKEDYSLDAIITPVFDPKMATLAQKIARAQTELDAVMKNPVTAQNPAVLNAAYRRFFEAIESENIEELVPEIGEAPEPERIDDQRVENMQFLMPGGGKNIGVFPEQNHEEHLAIIEELVNSPYAAELAPDAAALLQNHRQQHIAYLYGVEKGLGNELVGAGEEAANVDAASMGAEGGDTAGLGALSEGSPPGFALGDSADLGATA